ncbi:protein distal antenna-like [Diachasmimorpha longicaudata]|uniref:protein distal antenna-like n=1 Tax=Diachasmimorpha longicaudata TaxID=58733 RepID=UPI0030B905F2
MRGESARPGKRPLRALSASEKMEAIQRVHEGESKASVARDIGVPESTLRGWCKSEQKIRGMARNSSTPDSEAHSPISSAANLTIAHNNHSSEEEGPCAKRSKVEMPASSSYTNENSENDARMSEASRIDYMTNLMTSMAGMRPENSALLLQQLSLLSGGANPLAKGLLNMPMVPHSSAVGLVENGLQYTKSNAVNAVKRHSLSAIAPAQTEAVKSSRKSLPPAAEAPHTPVPTSPRKTSDTTTREKKDNQPNYQNHQNRRADETLWMWLRQQQQLLGQQSAAFNLSNNQGDGSWFWQWYKQYNYPSPPQTATPVAKKSPSKTRALLDSVLCNNNNENVNHFIVGEESDERESGISSEEAIEHGEKFVQWLEKCSEPAVSRVQLIQFKYLIDNLKACRKKNTTAKQSRK